MGSVIWNKKKILEFNDADKDLLIASCNTEDIKYIIDHENIILFPALLDKILILRSLTNHRELNTLIKQVEALLIDEGATVILDENVTDKATLEYLDAQIVIGFSSVEQPTDLTIYLPFNFDPTSISISKNLLKQLNLLETKITYKIADTWNKLCGMKYWSYIFGSSNPTLVLEIAIPTKSPNFLTSLGEMLTKSILNEVGDKPSSVEKKHTLEFLDKLKEKRICKDVSTKEQKELEEVTYKLECCENELRELKRSYREAEEKLHKIEEDTELKSSQQEKTIDSIDISDKSGDQKGRRKKTTARSKKIYVPLPVKRTADQGYSYQQLPILKKYLDQGPVHQFQRPSPNSSSVELPPSFVPKYSTGKGKKNKKNKNEKNKDEKNKEKSHNKEKLNNTIREVSNIYNIMYPK